MKRILSSGIIIAAFCAVSAGSSLAADDKKLDPIEKLKQTYTFTETQERCINTRAISSTRVIDDKTILFRMRGRNQYYLNEMSRSCPRLKFENRFSYTLRGGTRLCDIDIITVLDNFMNSWASCGLGKFRKLEKIPKEEKTEAPES